MNTKNITIGVFVATTIVLGIIALKSPSVVSVPTSLKIDASSFGTQKAPIVNVPAPVVNVNVPKATQTLGSVSSPDINSPYFSVGTIEFWTAKTSSLVSASTTICALQSPSATSTLLSHSVRLLLATTTNLTSSNSTVASASTSKTVMTDTVTANVQKTINASTTNANSVFEPNTYLVVKGDSTNIGGASATGVCQAVWVRI